MKRIQIAGKRTIKGRAHKGYLVTDEDIALTARVTRGAVVGARHRGELETLHAIVAFIIRRRLTDLF